MVKCAVYGCVNNLATSDSTIQYYFFPTHPVIAQQWINACCIWPPETIDINTAKVCSIHFDSDSYTSEYKMVDYLGVYAKVLKYDAVPTLYLPQQEIIIKESPPPTQMKQMLLYDVATQEQNFETPFTPTGLVLENAPENNIPAIKYEELRNIPPVTMPHTENPDTKAGVQKNLEPKDEVQKNLEAKDEIQTSTNASAESSDNYKKITYKQLNDIKAENEKLRKELPRFQQNMYNLKLKLHEKINSYKKIDAEYSKIYQQHSTLERKCMSVGDQKNLLSKVFSESQIKILSGKKKIYWSNDDMAIGYTIRHMSSKRCYMYLSKKLNIPLPALSSIKRWQTLKKDEFVKEENIAKEEKNDDSNDDL